MSDQRIALVTGANKGIGLAIAQGLAEQGLTVLVGSRNLENGIAAARNIGPSAHGIQLDVTDAASISAAAERIRTEFGGLDVLINNAGVSHAGRPGMTFPEIMKSNSLAAAPMDDVRVVWDTNVFGLIAVTQALLPLLRASDAGRIVTIGSSGGSMGENAKPDNAHRTMYGNYSSSKSAAHAATLAFALTLESTNIKVNIACPGHTGTALNNFSGARTPEQGARRAIELALIGNDGPTGTFSDENGPVAW